LASILHQAESIQNFDLVAQKEASTAQLGATSHAVTDLCKEYCCKEIVARTDPQGILLKREKLLCLRTFSTLHSVMQGNTKWQI